MDEKSILTLEFDKILERVTGYCAFSVSVEKALKLRPAGDLFSARKLLAQTSEAVELLSIRPDLSIGGARDIRQSVDLAKHEGVLTPGEFLDIKGTLISARNLERVFQRSDGRYPNLDEIAGMFPPPTGLVDAVSRTISDRGDVLDSASDRLSTIRRDMRVVHDRLLAKLQKMVSSPEIAPILQEALVTQRDGRYVLPLRAEHKGKIKAVVHDQSVSGATLFIEPLSVVDLNNQYRELQLEERDEERRVLVELSVLVGRNSGLLLEALDVIAELDLCFSRAKYAQEISGTEPVLKPIVGNGEQGFVLNLKQARHPLLDPDEAVAVDLSFPKGIFSLVLTGPNTGGKTVTLKMAGLLVLMSQSGIFIPAQAGSEIGYFDSVYADIGDEQSIEQSLSTFSAHINNIVRIIASADIRSLVILDELGAGTDPQEGAALARALLKYFIRAGIATLVSTHHPELKTFANDMEGVQNASMEFDLNTLKPTFRLTIGLPGRSNAIAIAERLGMPEDIINEARKQISPQDLKVDDLLDEIRIQKDQAEYTREEAEKQREAAERLRKNLLERLENIEDERARILISAQDEIDRHIDELKEEIKRIKKKVFSKEDFVQVQKLENELKDIEAEFELPLDTFDLKSEIKIQREIESGDEVRHRKLDTRGVVTTIEGDEAEIQVGSLRVRARLADLELLNVEEEPELTASGFDSRSANNRVVVESQPSSPGIELNLRGQRADDAITNLERYLDSAYLAGLPFVRIIHGKGTGKLRQAVRDHLRHNPNIKSFQGGEQNEGGEGVTVAKLDV